MRILAALIALASVAGAESWPSFEQYVRSCTRIVKAKAAGTKDGEMCFELLESWKGKRVRDDEEYRALSGEHGVEVNDGQEIVFFFTNGPRHSTSFPIEDGKLLYASTSEDDDLRRSYTVAEFEERVRILQLPMVATADKQVRLQARGRADGAAGLPLEFELERDSLRWHGSEIYFDEEAVLVEAIVDGEPLPELLAHASVWPWGSPRVQVHGIRSPVRLDRLVIEVGVIRVVESKAYRFEKLALGKSARLSAPPFAFEVEAAESGAMVVCELVRDEQLRAIEKALDTQTLTPMWAFEALLLTDAQSRFLERTEGGGNHRAGAYDYALASAPHAPLPFPLSLSIRIPTKIVKERIRFEFRDFKLER
jgi:hypothetical protein